MKISDLKQFAIIDYLQSLGLEPVKSSGKELVYYSPKTNEKTPSFFVNPNKNVFFDYSSNESGDIIRLVQYLNDFDFATACKHLETMGNGSIFQSAENSFSFCRKSPESNANAISINTVKPLQANSLISYCEGRKIPFQIAYKYLKEVHYTNNKKSYYSLGFVNDMGGFELRNQHFKGSSSPKGITTLEVPESKDIYLFEGFFDLLSAFSFFGTYKSSNTIIVLNSIVNIDKAKERLKGADKVHCFLDRDTQGIKALEKLSDSFQIVDRSNIYEGYKDFNEFLINNQP
ncbi:toprim domain-containing protein [Arcicella sp. DC2W]|uniref:Toprim domain-containing protein n=1 Tax=Arcicella gelida TaxID=2984195 RepID=A0ABU5S134_9BACT|nr:toprim domain-containing protein [Arcicella sp. DC2W]MEA5402158.1 toprim domain-containing protein [Arcicella sp. DC2W]